MAKELIGMDRIELNIDESQLTAPIGVKLLLEFASDLDQVVGSMSAAAPEYQLNGIQLDELDRLRTLLKAQRNGMIRCTNEETCETMLVQLTITIMRIVEIMQKQPQVNVNAPHSAKVLLGNLEVLYSGIFTNLKLAKASYQDLSVDVHEKLCVALQARTGEPVEAQKVESGESELTEVQLFQRALSSLGDILSTLHEIPSREVNIPLRNLSTACTQAYLKPQGSITTIAEAWNAVAEYDSELAGLILDLFEKKYPLDSSWFREWVLEIQ